jgi:tRNA(Arg) A34 adenosine deaminase TadA
MSKKHEITAIIYDKKGNVLSIGKNSYLKTHTRQAHFAKLVGEDHKVYLHAEVHAITRCRNIEKAHKILITRYHADGRPAYAAPCHICQEAIRQSGIKIIEHT